MSSELVWSAPADAGTESTSKSLTSKCQTEHYVRRSLPSETMNQPMEAAKAPAALPVPREIIIKETGVPVAYACPGCGLLFLFGKNDSEEDRRRKHAEASTHCVKHCACGNPLDYHYLLLCTTCRAEKEAKKVQRAFERATKITIEDYPDDPIFWEGHSGDMGGDGYFSNIDALLDHCEAEGIDLPSYVWACTRHEFKVDARDFIENQLSYQDIDPEATCIPDRDYDALQKMLDGWIAGQGRRLHAWFQDTSRAIVLRDLDEKG